VSRARVDEPAGTDLERALQVFVPQWVTATWRLDPVDYSL
jgi:hypothetical protein